MENIKGLRKEVLKEKGTKCQLIGSSTLVLTGANETKKINTPSYEDWITPEKLDLVTQGVAAGMTIKQLCQEVLEISTTSFYKYCQKYDEFNEAYYLGKCAIVEKVEQSLEKQCCGYFVTETTTKGTHYVCETTRYIPPDTKAIIFYLKNRGRKNWCEHWDVDVNGDFKPVVIKDDLEK